MTTAARVVLTLELHSLGSWGDDCQLSQVYKQAAESAVGRIRNAIEKGYLSNTRLIGEPIVTAVLATEEKR